MKFYFSLAGLFALMLILETFVVRLLPPLTIPISLSFIIAISFYSPLRTRYPFRACLPPVVVCALVLEFFSSLGYGITFFISILVSILVVNLSLHIPRKNDFVALGLTSFFVVLFSRIVGLSAANGFGAMLSGVFVWQLLFTSFFCSTLAVFFFWWLRESGSKFIGIFFSIEQ